MNAALILAQLQPYSFKYNHALKVEEDESAALTAAELELQAVETAQQIIQAAAQEVQQKAHEKIASVVSRCLAAVFDDPYEFDITFERKRGRTEAVLSFTRGGKHYDPLKEVGGGVVDLASFALRVAALVLARPKLNRVLFLDEPFKMISKDYSERVAALLDKISEEMGIQIIMVTHNPKLATGKIIKIGSSDTSASDQFPKQEVQESQNLIL